MHVAKWEAGKSKDAASAQIPSCTKSQIIDNCALELVD